MDEEDCSSITRNVLGQSASVVNNVIFVWIFCDNTGQMKNTIYHHHCLACYAVEFLDPALLFFDMFLL